MFSVPVAVYLLANQLANIDSIPDLPLFLNAVGHALRLILEPISILLALAGILILASQNEEKA